MAVALLPSTCTECLVHCGSLIHLEDGNVTRITGNPDHPVSKGAFCIKGMNAPLAARNSPTRLLHPLRRVGGDRTAAWEAITWDVAFDEIARRLAAVRVAHGPLSIAGAAATFTQSRGTAVRLMLRGLGSPNFMINQDMCHGGRSTAGLLTGFGGAPGSELRKASVILVVGKSPSESDIIEWKHIQEAKSAGATLIAVDPRRTKVARLADHWLAPKVGTDVALALSMIHVILSERLFDAEFVANWCSGTDELAARAAHYAPAIAESITGVPADAIVAAARTFAQTKPGCLVLGHGIDAHENAVGTAIAFQSLLALTGNIDRPGTNRAAKQAPGYRGSFAYFNQAAAFQMPHERQEQILGGAAYPLWAGPESWTQTCHNPTVLHAIMTGAPYPVRALYVSGTNIVCTYPDQDRTVAALKALDLLVVASDEMTPTAELADYVLPKTTLLEEEEILMAQGEPCIEMTRQIFAPRGEARSDVEIVAGLYEALLRHGAVEFDVFPWRSNAEFNAFVLKEAAIDQDDLVANGFVAIPYDYEGYRKTGFRTPSKKFEFNPARLAALGLDPLPQQYATIGDQRDATFDLVLMTGVRSMALHHSRFLNHRWARRLKNAPELTIHPATAARLAVGNGDWVRVQTRESPRRVLLKARIADDIPLDVVATGAGWWYPEATGPDRGAASFSVGMVMPYGPDFDPVSGSPAQSRNTVCRIERAALGEVEAAFREAGLPESLAGTQPTPDARRVTAA